MDGVRFSSVFQWSSKSLLNSLPILKKITGGVSIDLEITNPLDSNKLGFYINITFGVKVQQKGVLL